MPGRAFDLIEIPDSFWQRAWLDLGRGREALVAAQSALDALTGVPPPRRPLSQVNGVRIDMATACLLTNNLDGGAEAIKPVLAQPA